MCGLWHETMHLLECERQHMPSSYMWLVFQPLPGLHYTYVGYSDNPGLIRLSGGLYTSIVCFILSIVFTSIYWFLSWIFVTLGCVQLVYGWFEYKYITEMSVKKYFMCRYTIYVTIVVINLLLLKVLT